MEVVVLFLVLACGAPNATPPKDSSPSSPVNTTSMPAFDPATGFERAADGAVNRVADVPSSPDDYAYGTRDCFGSSSTTQPACTPSDCTEHPNGRCASESCLNSWCTCVYACTSDADCGPDQACLRPEHGLQAGIPLPTCVPAECRTNADCASGECGVSVVPDSVTDQLRLACRTEDDLCRSDLDCDYTFSQGDICSFDGEEWRCLCSYCWCD